MKKFLLMLGLLLVSFGTVQGQTIFSQSQTFSATQSATNMAQIPENSLANVHTIFWTTTGTAVGTVTLQTSSNGTSYSTMSGSAAQSLAASGSYTFEGVSAAYVNMSVNIGTCTSCTITITYYGSVNPAVGNMTDGTWWVPLAGNCGAALTTGAYAANPANSGALSAPAMVRAAAGEQVLQVTTSAAASALTVDCDLSPPTRSTTGKGITVTGFNVFYAVQTSALTSVTTPVVNTITFPATAGATAAGTVATAGGTITVAPVSPILTTSTAGVCNFFSATFATPVLLNTGSTRLETTLVFNQTVASATVYQICGVQVLFQNNPL